MLRWHHQLLLTLFQLLIQKDQWVWMRKTAAFTLIMTSSELKRQCLSRGHWQSCSLDHNCLINSLLSYCFEERPRCLGLSNVTSSSLLLLHSNKLVTTANALWVTQSLWQWHRQNFLLKWRSKLRRGLAVHGIFMNTRHLSATRQCCRWGGRELTFVSQQWGMGFK